MTRSDHTAFCILDNPFLVWGGNTQGENLNFLRQIDSDFYFRTAKRLFFDDEDKFLVDAEDRDARKDNSSIARLLWNHGLENLIMLLGAYVQAPHAVHAFYLKCENKHLREIAAYLLQGKPPQFHSLTVDEFTLNLLVSAIHHNADWNAKLETNRQFAMALELLLLDYVRDDYRAEYNSIKHGLRASHGNFGLAFGIQEAQGKPAAPENMKTLFSSNDGSHFLVATSLGRGTKKSQRQQFSIRRHSVGWELEQVINELQVISILINNVASALRIHQGEQGKNVKFFRPMNAEEFWQQLMTDHPRDVSNFSFGAVLDLPSETVDAAKEAARYYKRLRTEH